MLGMRTTVDNDTKRVAAAADKAQFRNFGHASARIAKDAKASIQRGRTASEEGEPPRTRLVPGHNLRGAIRYAADKEGGLIGPIHSFIGTSGEAHEFAGQYEGDTFAERPFMGPALEQNTARFAQDWASSIGE
jgi:hypothetical protein